MKKPLFSVIIPTYHRNDLLRKCLNCLLSSFQTLNSDLYEVIISDDGRQSTAQSLVENEFSEFRWIEGPKKGPAANRNNAVNHARGEYIVFVDDDCLPDKEWLTGYASALSPDVEVYEGRTTCKEGICSPLQQSPTNEKGGYLWSCNMMIKKRLFIDIGKFDEEFPYPAMEDVDLRERLKEAGHQIKFVEAGVVDHPPRPIASGKQRGAAMESQFYYCAKTGRYSNDLRWHILYNLIRGETRLIARMPFSRDMLVYVAQAMCKIAVVVINLNSWSSKYKYMMRLKT